jgi:superfamily II DNA or RNA helicase
VISLRAYQRGAVEAAGREWRECRSTLIVLPTGTGKTVVAAEIIRQRAHLGRVLWLAHRGELLTQAGNTIAGLAGLKCDLEKGESYAQDSAGLVEPAPVVVASVQSMHKGRRTRFARDEFATIVVDEAHHAPAKSYRGILGWFSGAKVLGLTATPDRGDRVGLKAAFESVAYQYEIRRAIEEGYLTPIRQQAIECADLDLSDIKTVAGDLHQGELEKALTIDKVLHQIAGPLCKEAHGRPTVVFTVGVQQAHALADVLAGYGVRAVAIDGSLPQQVREERLAAYRSGAAQMIINCAVLTEGWDAPETACVAVARPTKSRALYAQMLGRGTRPLAGVIDGLDTDEARKAAIAASPKTDCMVLDFVGNAGRHTLVTPLDVLAGKPLPDDVRKRAKELTDSGRPSDEALAQAEQEAIDRARKEEERRLREAKIQAEVAYRKQAVDPFRIAGISFDDDRGPRATPKQLKYLEDLGIKLDRTPSIKHAKRLLDRFGYGRGDACSYKQAKILARNGLPVDLSRAEAKVAIDAIANNGWQCPPGLRERYMEAAE